MIFLFFYLLFAAASGYIWFQIFKYWSEENANEARKRYSYKREYKMSMSNQPKELTPIYKYEVKPLYIVGFIIFTLLSLVGAIIGMTTANGEEIDVVNIKIK